MLVFLTAALLLILGRPLAADTGTYRIVSYMVALTPHSDGTVAIQYYQKWLVTGGHIPWITIGTPNDDFEIVSFGGAVLRAASASESGWSGVRLDLNNDFQPGQTFEATCSIVQRRLFYANKEYYGLDFTPGWYDRASIDTLRVGVEFFATLDSVRAAPPPTLVSGNEMSWSKYELGAGERFTIHVSFPVGLFPAGIAQGNLKSGPGRGSRAGGLVASMIIMFVVFFVLVVASSSRRSYTGGRIFYGGFWGGGVGGARGGGAGGRSAGGGGGFGGASVSCACACVSCACACACAGGGGAGCSRKLEHTCPVCRGHKV
jgi:hypothetical protein